MTMRTITLPGSNGYWTGQSQDIEDDDGVPYGWVTAPIPSLADGDYAVIGMDDNGQQAWIVTTSPPPPVMVGVPSAAETPAWATALVGQFTPDQMTAIQQAIDDARQA